MSAAGSRLDWRSLDRAGLDRGFNNSAAVADSLRIVEGWEAESAALRAANAQTLDLVYGPSERNRVDFLKAGEGAPTLVFLHGGYWQMRSKETFTFAATGPLSAGINVALAGYTLAPAATLDQIVAEVRAMLDWLAEHLAGLGGDPGRVYLSGWSAGAHLAAMALDHPLVRGGLGISGLYDLEPVRHCYVNDKLGLDADAAERNSPLRHLSATSRPFALAVGSAELPLMRQQSEDYAAARRAAGLPTTFVEIDGADHFTIMDAMTNPDGAILKSLRSLVSDSPAT